MIEGTELAHGIWVLQDSDSRRNTTVLFSSAGEGPAAVVDPGSTPVELNALDKFASDMNSTISALIFTREGVAHTATERWPAAVVITPGSQAEAPLLPLPIEGWENVPLAHGMMAIYNRKSRILLPGAMLEGANIPALDSGSGADAYLQALEAIEALDVKLAVPSYGTAAQGKREVRARLTADRDYTQNLVRHVLTSLAANLPLERVLAVARSVYEDYPFLQRHLDNIEVAWREFGRKG